MREISRREFGLGALATTGVALASRGVRADTWPSRPVTIVVPFPAGGAPDAVARALGRSFGDSLGTGFVVDNRSGAGGNIGANLVAKAQPDGYTIFVTPNGPITNNTLLYRNLPYDPFKDFAPIAPLAELPLIIVAKADRPYNNIQELIAYAKANPGKVNVGVPGTGTIGHLASELLKFRTGIEYTIVPYRGSSPLTNDILAGQVDVVFDLMTTYLPHIAAGTLKPLAVSSAEKMPQLPNTLPVLAQGLEGFKVVGWVAILAPAGTPPDIVGKLGELSNAYLKQPASKELLGPLGMSLTGGTPADLSKLMRDEVALWKPIVEQAKITLE